MRVQQFDEQATAAFRALQFQIKDGDVATLTDEVTIEVIQPESKTFDGHFMLSIALPNGAEMSFRLTRNELLRAADMEDQGIPTGGDE